MWLVPMIIGGAGLGLIIGLALIVLKIIAGVGQTAYSAAKQPSAPSSPERKEAAKNKHEAEMQKMLERQEEIKRKRKEMAQNKATKK